MTDKKYKIVTISDHILAPSGVGLQAKYVVEHLVKTGKFQIVALAGAIRHVDYRPQKYEAWGDNVVIVPVDGYGTKELLRQIIDIEKPDAIWFITDPRFYGWLWQMEDEIHQQCPLIYWHVWDNNPYPKYNEVNYKSTDFIGCINKLTYNFLKDNGFKNSEYIPHGVPENEFTMLPEEKRKEVLKQHLGKELNEGFVAFYNSRNALRKRTGNVMYAWKEFLDMVPEKDRENCIMCMHTPPKDPEGQDLFKVAEALGVMSNVGFHDKKVENSIMSEFYNMSDVTISLSSEEGFGLSVLESLMCGTPVICTKTGGMQDQIIDSDTGEVFGHCLNPDARSLIGSQTTPYIWCDHIDPTTAAKALFDLYEKKKELQTQYKSVIAGDKARQSVLRRFNLPEVQKRWEEIIVQQIESFKDKKNSKKECRIVEI